MKRKPHSEAFHRIASGLEDALAWARGEKKLAVRQVERDEVLARIRERKARTRTRLSADAILEHRDAERAGEGDD